MTEIPTHLPQLAAFTLDEQVRTLTPDQEMRMLGVSSQYEFERYERVSKAAGHEIAYVEIQRNKQAYDREFIEDIPVSHPHTYYHINNKLYSEQNPHELFCVSSQIDPRERAGQTLGGFIQFQEHLMHASGGEIVAWYSPAGFAGTEEPFSQIYFDSGRLYLAFKNRHDQSTHIDIKINEEQFPIDELLHLLNGCNLDHPVNMQMDTNTFFSTLYEFAQINGKDRVVYTSRRDSDNTSTHTLQDTIEQIENQISLYFSLPDVVGLPPTPKEQLVASRHDIQNMYIEAIAAHMQQNGGRAVLYGCSTTSVIEAAQESAQATDFAGIGSRYSTMSRIMGQTNTVHTNYEDDPNLCRCSAAKGPHFHCPGTHDGEECKHAIVVGKGIAQCPICGEGKRC